MYYNKQYGLELLGKALNGVEGTSVLPYRVYRSPEEYNWRHFFGASRVLLRSNLDGSLEKTTWINLPRMDAYRGLKTKVRKMFNYWNRIKYTHARFSEPGQRDSFHIIAHRVELRRNYRVYLSLRHNEGKLKVNISNLNKRRDDRTWRQYHWFVDVNDLPRELARINGLKPKQAEQITERVKAAHEALIKELKAQGIDPKQTVFEASLATKNRSPTKLEFYDFLLKPKGDLGD
ncbi:MAG: hypothetical protein V1722_03570 [Candidatus Micrarchaeota archaeon]